MSVSANAVLADLQIQHHLQLQRLSSHEYQEMLKIFAGLARELAEKTILIDPTAPGRLRYRNERMAKLMKEGRRIISEKFTQMLKNFQGDMYELAKMEADFAVSSLSNAAGISIGTAMTANQMRAVVNSTYIEGGLLKDWFSRASQKYAMEFQKEIKTGMVAGEGVDRMVRRIIGNKREFPGESGLYEKQKRGTEALVRTAVMSISNESRMAAFRANEDVIKGYQWLATLDSRTCLECAMLDGRIWDTDGQGVSGNTFEFQEPPAHWSCRCVLTPLTALGDKLAQKQEGMERSSEDGYVPRAMTFEEWFATKDAAFQEEYLGKGRYEMWKNGTITFNDLITQKGRPITLEELKAETPVGSNITALESIQQ